MVGCGYVLKAEVSLMADGPGHEGAGSRKEELPLVGTSWILIVVILLLELLLIVLVLLMVLFKVLFMEMDRVMVIGDDQTLSKTTRVDRERRIFEG